MAIVRNCKLEQDARAAWAYAQAVQHYTIMLRQYLGLQLQVVYIVIALPMCDRRASDLV